MLKIVCPADSDLHVESKSIKLYLNSFNMTRIGDTAADCIKGIEARVKRDLDELLDTNTVITFYASDLETEPMSFNDFTDLGELTNLDEIDFTAFQSDADQLDVEEHTSSSEIKWSSNLLRSNCRVTNQPDWGDVFIRMKGKNLPTAESIAKYIVSHRTVSHFHEEICEMVFKHLIDAFKPEQLMVSCLYTRRGGLDINPIRATHKYLIPEFFTNPEYTIRKTLRQ
jgi:7-cyano-7-deazaguanine reductase